MKKVIDFIRKILWKSTKPLAVFLIIYAFIAGLLVPLKTGIESVDTLSIRTGETTELKVVGYNSRYTQAGDELRAWLKMDATNILDGVEEWIIPAKKISIQDDRNATIIFDIPAYLPTTDKAKDFSLLMDSPADGAIVLPSAVFVTQDSIDPAMALQVGKSATITGLHNEWRMTFPYRNILYETIRNTYFHVCLWFGMLFMFLKATVHSAFFLHKPNLIDDAKAASYTRVGLLFGILGTATGAIWANYTWGEPWSGDPKQTFTAVALLIYCAYFILRMSFEDDIQRGRISAVYNIFAFAALIPLIYVVPRMVSSMHPGAGGNIAFGAQDLDNTMRMVFYPAIIGWTLFGAWMANIGWRARRVEVHLLENE